MTLVVPLGLLSIWVAVTRYGFVSEELLISPQQVWTAFRELLASGELQTNVLVSLRRLAIGFMTGSLLGLVLGVLMALFRTVDEALSPLFQFLRQIPSVAFIPAFILIFGVEETFKIAIVAKAAFFPVALATYDGIKGLSIRHFEVASVYRMTRLQMIRHVLLPGAVPAVLSGLRISLGRAWLLLITAELLAADTGIGQMMQMGRQMFRIDVVMVGVALTGLIGFEIDQVFRLAERRLVRWRTR